MRAYLGNRIISFGLSDDDAAESKDKKRHFDDGF
jgi:hypothetical protein